MKPSTTYQVGGSHYQAGNGLDPWTIARTWGLGGWRMNVLKYLLRAPYKNGKEDLEKARHCLDYIIEHYEELQDEYGTNF